MSTSYSPKISLENIYRCATVYNQYSKQVWLTQNIVYVIALYGANCNRTPIGVRDILNVYYGNMSSKIA